MSLITLLVIVIVIGLICYVLQQLPLPPPWRVIAQAIVVLILLLYLLQLLPGVDLHL